MTHTRQSPAVASGASSRSSATKPILNRRSTSVFAQLPFWRSGTAEQRTNFALAIHSAAMRAETNVASLRRHPDLTERFVRELGYERVDQWNGYCPPAHISGPNGPARNFSSRRAVIVDILTEAAARDVAGR